MNYIEIINRIKEVLGTKNEGDVAEALGMKQSTFSERKSRGSIPYDELFVFCDKKNISYDWILSGRGPKTRKDKELLDKMGSSTRLREVTEIYRTTKSPLLDAEEPKPEVSMMLEKEIISYFPYMTDTQRYDLLDWIKDQLLSELIKKKVQEEWDGKERRNKQSPFNGKDKRIIPFKYLKKFLEKNSNDRKNGD